jgi:hypothetical protein
MSDNAKKIATIPLRRPYKETLLALVFFGLGAAFFFVRASNNDRGLILNGIIEMGPEGADWFYAIMGLLSAGMASMGLLGAWRISQIKKFQIDLRRKEMTFPAAPIFRTPVVTIPYDRIDAVEANAAFVSIREGSQVYSIPSRWIADGWTGQQIVAEVITRVRIVRAKKDPSSVGG